MVRVVKTSVPQVPRKPKPPTTDVDKLGPAAVVGTYSALTESRSNAAANEWDRESMAVAARRSAASPPDRRGSDSKVEFAPSYKPWAVPNARDLSPTYPRTWVERLALWFPGLARRLVNRVIDGIGPVTDDFIGLNLREMVDVNRAVYEMLVPNGDYLAPVLHDLALGREFVVLVHLGPGRERDARTLEKLFREQKALSDTPPRELPSHLAPVWAELVKRYVPGEPLIFVDIDGKPDNDTAVETISMMSVVPNKRQTNFDSVCRGHDPQNYFSWLSTRHRAFRQEIGPWMQRSNPALSARIDRLKELLQPAWLLNTADDPLGWFPSATNAREAAMALLHPPFSIDDFDPRSAADLADAVFALDQEISVGSQSYWTRFLQTLEPDRRGAFLTRVAHAFAVLASSDPKTDSEILAPSDAPPVRDPAGSFPCRILPTPFERTSNLAQVVSRTLDALGIDERRDFRRSLLTALASRRSDLEARESDAAQIASRIAGESLNVSLAEALDATDKLSSEAIDQLVSQSHRFNDLPSSREDKVALGQYMQTLNLLAARTLKTLDVRVTGDSPIERPLIVSPLFTQRVGDAYRSDIASSLAALPAAPLESRTLGSGSETLKMSIVLKGGGAKGNAYQACLEAIDDHLKDNTELTIEIDEYVGTSAGALIACLLAAGFESDEIRKALPDLDSLYSDYLWLMGGSDPQVRGLERNGLFSTRQLYELFNGMLQQKLGITDRPVLFKDLPTRLKVVSCLMTTNVPESVRSQFNIDRDGRIVFDRESCPNMEVAAAVVASAGVPIFFQLPELLVFTDERRQTPYRMQLADGGLLDNLPLSASSGYEDSDGRAITLPTYFENKPQPGEEAARLETLRFSVPEPLLKAVDEFNAARYREMLPGLLPLLKGVRDEGQERVTLAFNLTTPDEQTAPIVQGRTRRQTLAMHQLAETHGFDVLAPAKAQQVMDATMGRRGVMDDLLVLGFEAFADRTLDGNDVLSFWNGLRYKPALDPATSVLHVAKLIAAARVAIEDRHYETR
ncbi:MAG: patatin-like phospholipase family protein [Myxococcota bacterium]